MPERTRLLEIGLSGRLVGHLVSIHGATFFFVAPDYAADPDRPVLSQSFRGRTEEETRSLLTRVPTPLTRSRLRIPPFFANLLSEGALRAKLAAELRVSEDSEFDLLAAAGRDLPGAVTATLTGYVPPIAVTYFGEIVTENVSQHIGKSTTRFSLSGVQLKYSVRRNSEGRYVLARGSELGDTLAKLPNARHPRLPENEYASMRLARLAGVVTPDFWLADPSEFAIEGFGVYDSPVYMTRRFDRLEGKPVHIEDFAQVLNLRPADKYGHTNYDTVLSIVAGRVRNGILDAQELVRRLVVNILLGNEDAHIKNVSLIYNDPREPDLAPAYDIVSTVQYLSGDGEMALSMAGEKVAARITLETFKRLEKKAKLLRTVHLAGVAQETVRKALATWPDALTELPVSDRYRDSIRGRLRDLPLARDP